MGPEAPSGLFPSGPPRPSYREPHPVRGTGVLIGVAAGLLWILLFTLLGIDAPSYLWWAIGAATVAWVVGLGLARYGDRGVAVGISVAAGAGWTVSFGFIALYWSLTGSFPLW